MLRDKMVVHAMERNSFVDVEVIALSQKLDKLMNKLHGREPFPKRQFYLREAYSTVQKAPPTMTAGFDQRDATYQKTALSPIAVSPITEARATAVFPKPNP
jgi:hypothetical protein